MARDHIEDVKEAVLSKKTTRNDTPDINFIQLNLFVVLVAHLELLPLCGSSNGIMQE